MRKKSVLLLFVLSLFFVTTVFSLYDQVIFNDWAKSGEEFTINNYTYKVIYNRNTNISFVYLPDSTIIVIDPQIDNCRKESIYSVCQTGQEFYYRGNKVPADITAPNLNVSLFLQINSSDIGLNFSKVYSSNNFFVNEMVDVTIVVSKISGTHTEIKNIFLNDSYSEDFIISYADGCTIVGKNIIFQEDLYTSTKKCKYSLMPKLNTTFSNKINLNYDVFGKTQTKSIITQIDVDSNPIQINVIYPKKNFSLGEEFIVNITLNGIEGVSVNELYIYVPQKFAIKEKSDNLKSYQNNLYLTDFTILKDETKNYFFKLNSTKAGLHVVNLSVKYQYGSLKHHKSDFTVEYIADIFNIELVDIKNSTFLRITNPTDVIYRNVRIENRNESYFVQELNPKRFKEFNLSNINNTEKEFFVSYKTEYGQIVEKFVDLSDFEFIEEEILIPEEQELSNKKFEISQNIKNAIAVTFLILFFVLLIMNFFNKKTKLHGLDKEIDDIKKGNV